MRSSLTKGRTSGFFFSSLNISVLTFENKNIAYTRLHFGNIWLDCIYFSSFKRSPVLYWYSGILTIPQMSVTPPLTIINKSQAWHLQLLKLIYVREFSVEKTCILCTKLADLIHQLLTHPQAYPGVHSRRWMRITGRHRWVPVLSTKALRGVGHSDPVVSRQEHTRMC